MRSSLSAGCQPPRLKSRSLRLHLGTDRAPTSSALRRQRRPSADRASAASNRRLDIGIVNRAPTTLAERPLNADRASTERRPSAPATRGPLWRRLVFGVCGSLGGLYSHAGVPACSCCASPNTISVLSLASLSALSTSGVPHCSSLASRKGAGSKKGGYGSAK